MFCVWPNRIRENIHYVGGLLTRGPRIIFTSSLRHFLSPQQWMSRAPPNFYLLLRDLLWKIVRSPERAINFACQRRRQRKCQCCRIIGKKSPIRGTAHESHWTRQRLTSDRLKFIKQRFFEITCNFANRSQRWLQVPWKTFLHRSSWQRKRRRCQWY